MKNKTANGFSLVELLSVITIVAIIIGVTFPVGTAIKNNAIKLQTKTQFAKYVLALEAYKSAYGTYPAFAKANELISLHDNSESFIKAMYSAENDSNFCTFDPSEINDAGKIIDGFGNSQIFLVFPNLSDDKKISKNIFPPKIQKSINSNFITTSIPLAFSFDDNYCVTSW